MFRRLSIPALMLALAMAGSTYAQQSDRTFPATLDLDTMQLVEIRDGAGQVILNGTFVTKKNDAKETERTAELKSPTGQSSKGKVEVEIERKDGAIAKAKIELEAERLDAMTTMSVLIDGQPITAIMTSKSGKAEIELTRKAVQ
jgi:hypothetical protein